MTKYGTILIVIILFALAFWGGEHISKDAEYENYYLALSEVKPDINTPVFASTSGPQYTGSKIGETLIGKEFLTCLNNGQISSARIPSERNIVLDIVDSKILIQLDLDDGKVVSSIVWRQTNPELLQGITKVKLECTFPDDDIVRKAYELPLNWTNK